MRAAALLSLLLLLPAAGGAGRPLELRLVSPRPGEAVFGAVEVAAEVSPPGALLGVARVDLYLDGLKVGSAAAPPYRVRVDVGQENVGHHFEAVAYGKGGENGPLASAGVRTPPFRADAEIDVRLRQLFVTVESGGQAAAGIGRADLAIYERGVEQPIVTFGRGDLPLCAALLLDASASMEGGRLAAALDGARRFVGALSRLDEAKLLLFADRVRRETPFTAVPAILTLGLAGVEAGGGTALNDALYLALKRLEERPGRQVVVLLSDGIDVDSVLPMAQVRAVAARGGAVIYWLRLRRPEGSIQSAWRDAAGHRRELAELSGAVRDSGGRIVTIDRVEQARDALGTIVAELRGQYVLGYYSADPQGGTAGIEVKARRAGLEVRFQRGSR